MTENVCMVDAFGHEPVCTANDVQLGIITDVIVTDSCDGTVGDTATVTLTASLDVGSSDRYDIGVWL